jgi:hypothetical protein
VQLVLKQTRNAEGNIFLSSFWIIKQKVHCAWNVTTHSQKSDFVFRRNGRVHLNRRVRPFSRLLTAEVCASAVVMLDTPCFEVVWRVLTTHSIRQFPLHFPSRASPCAITFQLDSNEGARIVMLCLFWFYHLLCFHRSISTQTVVGLPVYSTVPGSIELISANKETQYYYVGL